MSEIRPRITGTEMEWPINYRLFQSDEYNSFNPTDQYVDATFGDDIKKVIRSAHQTSSNLSNQAARDEKGMASNGARIYRDQEKMEYATPEDTSLIGTVTNELASERILINGLARYMRGGYNTDHTFNTDHAYISKRVADESGSWGYHINLSADNRVIPEKDDRKLHLLGLHIATSQAMLGAGAIHRNDNGEFVYSLSQKTKESTADFGQLTLGKNKYVVNTRNQPLASGGDLARIHVTSMDPHISPWASWMSLGTNSLVLRAIEQGHHRDLRAAISGENSTLTDMARRSADDLSGQQIFEMKDGRHLSALDIQAEIIEIVSKTEHTDEEAAVLSEWKRAVGDIEVDHMRLYDRSDAIAKLSLLKAAAKKNNLYTASDIDYSSPSLRQLDIRYSNIIDLNTLDEQQSLIDPMELHDKTIASRLRKTAFAANMPSQDKIIQAVNNPPETTRAYRRGRAIGWGAVKTASWVGYTQLDGKIIDLGDPYDTEFFKKRNQNK